MRNMFATLVIILVLLVVGVAGLGYYRGWFQVGKTSDPETGQTEIKLRIDKDKVTADVEKARQQVSPTKAQAEEK